MSLEVPAYLYVAIAVLVGLTVVFAFDLTRRKGVIERLGHVPQLQQMMASLAIRRRIAKYALLTATATLMVLCLARPQGKGEAVWVQRGIDLVVALDFSKSMLARDIYPSRLLRMIEEVETLLDRLESDRVGVVVFAGAAAHFPLTEDHLAARSLFRGLHPNDMPPGSDLGEAIRMSRCVLRRDLADERGCHRRGGGAGGGAPLSFANEELHVLSAQQEDFFTRARAIVVFGDGEDTGGQAGQEVEEAVRLGLEVFFVGVGTTAGQLIPEYDDQGVEIGWKKTADNLLVTTRLEERRLVELAGVAGGEAHYLALHPRRFPATELLDQLRRLKQGDLPGRAQHRPEDVYQLLLFPAFLLLVAEACMSERRRAKRQRWPVRPRADEPEDAAYR